MEFCITFTSWLFVVLLVSFGLYRLWALILGPAVTDWLLLPATVVSEIAYSIGNLLCGRPAAAGLISHSCNYSAPMQIPTGRGGFFVSMLSALLCIAAGVGGYAVATREIGEPVVTSATVQNAVDVVDQVGAKCGIAPETLPAKLPTTGEEAKEFFDFQLKLIKRIAKAWQGQDWQKIETYLFCYLAICFGLRLNMVRHDWRAMLITVIIICGVILGVEHFTGSLADRLVNNPWILMTFIWGMMLYLILLTIFFGLTIGLVRLVRKKGNN